MTSSHTSHQSLKWTRPLIDELCKEIQQILEQWADEDADRSEIDLDQAADAGRKIAGSMSVLQYESGETLGECMAQVVEALNRGDIDKDQEEAAVTSVLEATATLPDYLDYLESTYRDAPLVLIGTINALRGYLGQAPLDEGDFFNPPVESVPLPEGEAISTRPEDIRREYQHALRGFLVDKTNREALDTLQSIGLKIRDQAEFPDSVRRTGWTAAGLVAALQSEQVESSSDTARLFARLDVILKQLGESQDVDEAANQLSRDFLFDLADAGPGEGLSGELFEAFSLADHATGHGDQTQVFLAGQNRALFTAVTQAAREDLAQIKETLGSQLEGALAPDVLEQQTQLLESVGESLSMLGLENLARRIKAQAGHLADLSADPDDPALLAVARELLVVESQLEDSFSPGSFDDSEEDEDELSATLLPPSEQRRVLRQLLIESLEDLTHAKSLLDALNRGKADADAAREAHDALDRISSALFMAELDDGARLVEGARLMVFDNLVDRQGDVEQSLLETLAEALTVAELYLESMSELDTKGREHFDTARSNLDRLGYWPDEVVSGIESGAEAATPDRVDSEAPLADELPAEDTEVDEPAEDFEAAIDIDEGESGTIESSAPVSGPDSDIGDDFDDFDIVEIFLEEFDQELESLDEMLSSWRASPNDSETQVTIRRSFHSLKGSGRMAGASEIGEYAWEFENLMNQILEERVKPDDDLINLVTEGVRALPSMRARLSGEGEQTLDETACVKLAKRARAAAEGKSTEPETEAESATTAPETEGMDPTLVGLMIKELSENLETLDKWLAEAEENGLPGIIDDPLVRAVHTMKGTMRLAPIRNESETAQIFEQYLEELAHASAPPTESGYRAIEQCGRIFHLRLDRLQGTPVDDDEFDTTQLGEELRNLHNQAHRDRDRDTSQDYDPAREQADEPLFSSEADSTSPFEGADTDFFGLDENGEDSQEPESAEQKAAPGTDEPDDVDDLGDEDKDELDEDLRGLTHFSQTETPEEQAEPSQTEQVSDEASPESESDAELEANTQLDSLDQSDQELPSAEPSDQAEDTPEPEVSETDFYADLNEDLLEAFLEEAQEVLEHADDSLQQWRESPNDKAMITGLQRDLHTIKGSSRMVGLDKIGGVAHVMEELLEGIAAGIKKPSPEHIDALEAGCDHLHAMVDAVLKREPMPAKAVEQLLGEGAEADEPVATEEIVELAEEVTDTEAEESTQISRTENLRVPMDLVDDLVNYAGEISIFRSRLEEQVTVFRVNVAEIDETVIRLRDQLRKLEIETEAQILARYEREHGPTDETFDPLELDRYSTIQQLSRGLGESVSDLTSLTSILDDATRQSETLLMQQSRVNTELQEGLMQARMVAFNTLLPRLRRVVRNAARELGKKAELAVSIEGEGELDRSVLDRITAPIEHLLRNAISHGIEMPEARRNSNKPETGHISIDVSREATELVIRVNDDGGGLNLDAIRKRGLEQGLITEGETDEATIAQLIFRPGFSTAKQVSQLAGRGIGMDVVANEVRQIGGNVGAQTDAGKGTRFTIRIPLSLTVMQAIMVRVAERQFAIPLQAVRGVTRMLSAEWQRQINSEEPHQEYAGENYPLLELEPQLGFDAEDLPEGTLSLLMIEAGEHRAALRVSELQGHREIVIKPVGPQISSITGILGGTVTGDGQVVPILDMGPLIRQAFDRELLPGHEFAHEYSEEIKRTPLVMVVDDSITMRRVTARVLEHRGLEVMTARDGLDAVETMFDRVPDLMLLDIEMPRMDGYELATHVRNDPRLKDIPMIMITSRSGEKHRQHAKELGVNGYLTKPYQEADLIEHVFEHLKMPVPQG